ncbi:MAG TPA: S8 family peptidase [Thermoanaerobacterales bacterium]|uniref:S8 family peptidase n=1 Tax=Tepidanaerobacter sp. GT38 TaxID=2722793 RepID=UPI0017A5A84C|nr:S8 family peptidase [Tepidanaerobacter sp. GT38]HHY42960.1 S8 family peptidase [Thermoanaerobacterales bacterium]
MFSYLLYVLALGVIGTGLIQKKKHRPKYKIIGFRDEVSIEETEGILSNHGIKIKKHLPLANACLCLVDEISAGFKSLTANDNIEFIEDDYIAMIQVIPQTADSLKIKSQTIPWGISKIEAPKAWKHCQGEGIKVGIIDTGIDQRHPDLKANIKVAHSVVEGTGADDDNGHGTHVAGTIAALDNDIGVVGVAPKAEIYSVKAFDNKGRGRVSDIIDALNWCIENKVHIINMSFGFSVNSQALERAIREVHKHNIIMVAAAGNSGGKDTVLYPAKYPEVIAVAASDNKDKAADFSSSGPEVNIIAPGVDISSTYINQEYRLLSGTSMACPHVVGACALLMSISGADADNVKNAVLSTARDIGLPEETQGAGLVDVSAAVSNIKKTKGGFFYE